MKLINRTRVPDELLEPLLILAGRRVGARTRGVVVQVNPGRFAKGMAYECIRVRWTPRSRRWLDTDGGAFKVTLPSCGSALWRAMEFADVAAHEWCHIREYQQGGSSRFPFSRKAASGRRPAHRFRPEEVRVRERLLETAEDRRCDDATLALGLWLDAEWNGSVARVTKPA